MTARFLLKSLFDWVIFCETSRYWEITEGENLVEEEDSQENKYKTGKFLRLECLMTNSLVCQEEWPYKNNSTLLYNRAVSCRSIFRRERAKSVEACCAYDKTNSEEDNVLVWSHLLNCQLNVINMTVNALIFLEGASQVLSRHYDKCGEQESKKAFPAHHVAWLLAYWTSQNFLLNYHLSSMYELGNNHKRHSKNDSTSLGFVLSVLRLVNVG